MCGFVKRVAEYYLPTIKKPFIKYSPIDSKIYHIGIINVQDYDTKKLKKNVVMVYKMPKTIIF